jgi:o-succinylbenzoate---CoA ligase
MPQPHHILTINNIRYNLTELMSLAANKGEPWLTDVYTFIKEWCNDEDTILVKTSGSTGTPKPILLKKNQMIYSAQQTCRFFNITSESALLLCLPAAFIAGKMMIVRAMVSGANLMLNGPVSNPFEKITEDIDFAAITPFQLHHSFDTLQHKNNIKTLIVGGGEINPVLEEKIQQLQTSIYATYGMTETSTHVALRPVNGPQRSQWFSALGETKFSVDQEDCLIIDNSNLTDTPLITKDIAELKGSRLFRWLGRRDNIINSGGIKLIPEEIESQIAPVIKTRFIIDSITHETLGQAPVLILESVPINSQEEQAILEQMKGLLHPYAMPHNIYCMAEFPTTATGKVDRRGLRGVINNED